MSNHSIKLATSSSVFRPDSSPHTSMGFENLPFLNVSSVPGSRGFWKFATIVEHSPVLPFLFSFKLHFSDTFSFIVSILPNVLGTTHSPLSSVNVSRKTCRSLTWLKALEVKQLYRQTWVKQLYQLCDDREVTEPLSHIIGHIICLSQCLSYSKSCPLSYFPLVITSLWYYHTMPSPSSHHFWDVCSRLRE